MEGKSVDLHMHSHYSGDGQFTPAQLVEQCLKSGIRIMAIADHNCQRANEEGKKAAREAGIIYIPAIEIDCTYENVNLHLLGYGIEDHNGDFAEIEHQIRSQGETSSRQMLLATREMGFCVTEEEMRLLAQDNFWKESWTGEMFADVLLHKPEYKDHPLLKPYRAGGTRCDNPYVNFYWDFYSQGKPCYAEVTFPSLQQVIETVHKSGGLAVLAHPGVNLKNCHGLLQPIIKAGLDGLEAFSSYHTKEQSSQYYQEAVQNGLFVTCGSDYHGKTKPSIPLGGHGCTLSEHELMDNLSKILKSS